MSASKITQTRVDRSLRILRESKMIVFSGIPFLFIEFFLSHQQEYLLTYTGSWSWTKHHWYYLSHSLGIYYSIIYYYHTSFVMLLYYVKFLRSFVRNILINVVSIKKYTKIFHGTRFYWLGSSALCQDVRCWIPTSSCAV